MPWTFLIPLPPPPQRARGTCSISFRACHKDYKTWHCLFWSTSQLIQPHVNPKKQEEKSKKIQKHWKARNPYLHNFYIYCICIWGQKSFGSRYVEFHAFVRLFVMLRTATFEVTFTISCHAELQTPHGVAIAIATWTTWTTRDRATPTPFMAWRRSLGDYWFFSIFDLHKSLFELILGDANCVRQIFNPWLSHVCT